MNALQEVRDYQSRQRAKTRAGCLPLAVQAKDYAEGQADVIYLRVWPLDAAGFERALANAFEAGWRARG